jgi:hypothetical protein
MPFTALNVLKIFFHRSLGDAKPSAVATAALSTPNAISAGGSCFSVPVKDVPATGVNTELRRALFVGWHGDSRSVAVIGLFTGGGVGTLGSVGVAAASAVTCRAACFAEIQAEISSRNDATRALAMTSSPWCWKRINNRMGIDNLNTL